MSTTRGLLVLALCVALMVLAYAVERRCAPDKPCWRCGGVGEVQRWHRLTWKQCPRCGGEGTRPRWGTR